MIDITLLGCAALLPIPERALTAAALTCAGRTLLFDCGEGTQTAARKAGVSLMKADVIALTHYHGDHIFGLPGLMQTLNSLGRTEPLAITGPLGLNEAMEPVLRLAGRVGYPVRLVTLPAEGAPLRQFNPRWPDEVRLSAFPTEHRTPSQGYAFTLGRSGKFLPERARALGVPAERWGVLQRGQPVQVGEATIHPEQVLGPRRRGIKFVFSGDTAPCESLIKAARGADLFICEATYGENDQAALALDHGHMTFAQAGQIAARAGVSRLWLTHYSQMIEDPEACLPNARAYFEPAQCGCDGVRATLAFEGGEV